MATRYDSIVGDLAAASRSRGHVSKQTKTRINPEPMRWLRELRYFLAKPEDLSSNPRTRILVEAENRLP